MADSANLALVIFAGGYGSRLSELTEQIPKPLVEIGETPIIMHIMRYYACFGVKRFIICAGYRYHLFNEYFSHIGNRSDRADFLFGNSGEDNITKSGDFWNEWSITVLNTGLGTPTGGRLSHIKEIIKDDSFFLTYGDGLSNVNIAELLEAHDKNYTEKGILATLSAVLPPPRYGLVDINADDVVTGFAEKKQTQSYVNGGFFVLNRSVLNHINSSADDFEVDILPSLAGNGLLGAYRHHGFWQSMDTLRDKKLLEEIWQKGNAPWRIW